MPISSLDTYSHRMIRYATLYFLLREKLHGLFIHIPLTTYSANIWLGDYECIWSCGLVLVYELFLEETADRVMSQE